MPIFREKYILKGQIVYFGVFLSKKNWSMRSGSYFFPPDDGRTSLYRTSPGTVRCQSSCKCTQYWKSINEGPLSMIKTCFVIESINDAFVCSSLWYAFRSCLISSVIITISYSLIDTSKCCLCNRTVWENSKDLIWISFWGITGGKMLVGPFCAFRLATILVNPSTL